MSQDYGKSSGDGGGVKGGSPYGGKGSGKGIGKDGSWSKASATVVTTASGGKGKQDVPKGKGKSSTTTDTAARMLEEITELIDKANARIINQREIINVLVRRVAYLESVIELIQH